MPDDLTERIIGAAIEVHRILGPGLLESIYEEALAIELELRGLRVERQVDGNSHSFCPLLASPRGDRERVAVNPAL